MKHQKKRNKIVLSNKNCHNLEIERFLPNQLKNIKNKHFKIFNKSNILLLSLIIIILSLLIYIIYQRKKIKKLKDFYENTISKEKYNDIFEKTLSEIYKQKEFVNLNEIEQNLEGRRKITKYNNYKNEINIGISLDPSYILKGMMTLSSIIDSQYNNTKLKLHIAVVNNFSPKSMLKIYSLRKIREDVEFNFYNAKKVESDLENIYYKGPGLVAKLLLPQLIPENIERLIILDLGDVLVLRDLSEMYNWNMENNIYMGAPDFSTGSFGIISNKTLDFYINTGMVLINTKKVKLENMYEKFLQNKNKYKFLPEQNLLNDLANDKIGFLPMKFGLVPPYDNDEISNSPPFNNSLYRKYNYTWASKNISFLPKNYEEFGSIAYNPIIVHQWNGKWSEGKGLNIYRKLCQYYIKMAGIWEEICKIHPGYCIK